MNYKGIIIEESLEDKKVLGGVKIISTEVEKVTAKHKTPWLSQWTLRTVEIPEAEAAEIAEEISQSIDREHSGSWYADFKNTQYHFVIFRGKVFKIDLNDSKKGYESAKKYGAGIGIPEHQLDFD